MIEEGLIRKEQRKLNDEKTQRFLNKMKTSLALVSQTEAGKNVLRYILHESRFLAPLTHETAEGMNRDILLQSEAKRLLYLSLRAHMDIETIKRVEMEETEKKEDTNARPD